MQQEIIVRPVRNTDLPVLARLEDAAWKRHGIPALTLPDLSAWYEEYSPLFLVAESEGKISGYYFGRIIRFALEDAHTFLTPVECAGGWEWGRHPHDPNADSAYGICVVSVVPGAGIALNNVVQDILCKRRIRYFVGVSRLSRFDRFFKTAQISGSDQTEYDSALWYVHESASLLSMPVWTQCAPKPCVMLPKLRRPDPVLAFHVRGTSFGLLGVLPNYMPDAASRNYGAVILSEFPHRR